MQQKMVKLAKFDNKKTYAYSLQDCGVFLCSGSDASLFIKTMFTGSFQNCDVLFSSSCGLLLNSNAQVIDLVYVIKTGDNEYLILTSEQNANEDYEWLQAHANLHQDDNRIFNDLVFENETGKLASLLLFGKNAENVYKYIVDVCSNKVAIISTELSENSYIAPTEEAFLIFVPLVVASEIGEILTEFDYLEMIEPDEYKSFMCDSNQYYSKLIEGKYYLPSELGLNNLLRDEKNFVGAMFLEDRK